MLYDDPVTVPAADIAENPYWKRDTRRGYPRLSTVTQADAVALLEVGSAASPKHDLIGDAGTKQLVAVKEQATKGLSVAFSRNTGLAKDVLGPGGMPPLPSGMFLTDGQSGGRRYNLPAEQSYTDKYVIDSQVAAINHVLYANKCAATLAGTSHKPSLVRRLDKKEELLKSKENHVHRLR